MKIIIRDTDPDDFILAIRAAKWMMSEFRKDAVITYGQIGGTEAKDFYVRRNKSSITVRRAVWDK